MGDLKLAEFIEERLKSRGARPSTAIPGRLKLAKVRYGSLTDLEEGKVRKSKSPENAQSQLEKDKYRLLTQQLKNIQKMQHAHRRPQSSIFRRSSIGFGSSDHTRGSTALRGIQYKNKVKVIIPEGRDNHTQMEDSLLLSSRYI